MQLKDITIISVIVTQSFFAGAQTLRRPVAAPYTSLGAYSILHVDVFSFPANQAALAQLKKPAIGLYGERKFLLSELNSYTLATALTTTSGNIGLKANYLGFAEYNETQLGLAYGRKMGAGADIGAQINFSSIRIPGYGNSSALSFELGLILHLTEKLHGGIHVNNPVGGKFGKDQQEKLPSVYKAGLGYDASEKFFAGFEVEKEEDQPVNVNAGIQYKFISQLLARAGISSATSAAWFGLGLQLQSFRVDVTTSYHARLGLTPGLLLLFEFNKKAGE